MEKNIFHRIKMLISILALVYFCISPATSYAGIIYDYSPETYPDASDQVWYTNSTGNANHVEMITFDHDQEITGMDIYSAIAANATVGETVTIRLFSDSAGAPDVLLDSFVEQISIVDM